MASRRTPDAKASGAAGAAGAIGAGYRVLGIDPGTLNVGWAILELGQGLEPRAVEHGAIRVPQRQPIAARLGAIFAALEEIVARQRPHAVALEEAFYKKNFRSALRIGEGRGVALLVASRGACEVHEYPPATVKQTVCGNGRASKEQVQRMIVRLLLGGGAAPSTHDASDALAIALCHARKLRSGALFGTRPHRRSRSAGKALQALVERLGSVRK